MAKRRENKNRSYRERQRQYQEEVAKREAEKQRNATSSLKTVMAMFSFMTALLIVLACFSLIGRDLLFVWVIADIVYAGCCLIGYIKENDPMVKKTGIVMGVCAAITLITALICK